MMRRFFGYLGALAGLSLVSGSCVDDPLADLDATPAVIVASHSQLQITDGDSIIPVTASVVDGRFTPLAVPVTATTCDGAITAARDTTYNPVPPTSARFLVDGISPAASCVNINGGGLTKQVPVVVLPVAFGGALSTTTMKPWDTITVGSTASLRFDPALSEIDFGDGSFGVILSRTATSMQVVVPATDAVQPGPLLVRNVDVTFVTGLRVDLPTAVEVNNPNPYGEPSTPGGAVITIPDTILDGFPAGVVDRFYTITLAAPTTFTVTLDWPGATDVDILFCNAACTAFVGNFAGATGANPEQSTVTLGPGTFNIYINNFATPPAVPDPQPLYRVRITP